MDEVYVIAKIFKWARLYPKEYHWKIPKDKLEHFADLKKGDIINVPSQDFTSDAMVIDVVTLSKPPLDIEIKDVIDFSVNKSVEEVVKAYKKKRAESRKKRLKEKKLEKRKAEQLASQQTKSNDIAPNKTKQNKNNKQANKKIDKKSSDKKIQEDKTNQTKKLTPLQQSELVKLKELWREGKGYLPKNIELRSGSKKTKLNFMSVLNHCNEYDFFKALINGNNIKIKTSLNDGSYIYLEF